MELVPIHPNEKRLCCPYSSKGVTQNVAKHYYFTRFSTGLGTRYKVHFNVLCLQFQRVAIDVLTCRLYRSLVCSLTHIYLSARFLLSLYKGVQGELFFSSFNFFDK